MADKQLTGDQQKLGRSPVASPSANPKGGTMQTTGDRAPLSMAPVASPSANPSGGTIQAVGDKTPLNRTPVKGWGSAANLPMSQRAIAQSKTK
jgi:hypothetical protein